MQDKERFMIVLNEVLDKANENDKKITVEEIKESFGGELKKEQFEAIYTYLVENKVRILNYIPSQKREEYSGKEGEESSGIEEKEDSAYLRMYLEELEGIRECNDSEVEALCKDVVVNVGGASDRLIEGNLHMVVRIAKEYKGQGVALEDLIQEGNIGLMNGVMSIGEADNKVLIEYLELEVRRNITLAIDQYHYEKNIEEEAVIKVNRLSEKAKELEEELGRHPEVSEMASYMGISELEVKDIMRLSKESLTKEREDKHI